MNFRTRLRIDHTVGGFFVWLLNLLVRLAGKVAGRDHSLKQPPRAVLFLKFVGLGSISRASFLIRESRRRFPEARIYFCCFGECAQLARLYEGVDQVFVIREKNILSLSWDTLKALIWTWRHEVDLVVDLEVHSKYSSIFSALSLARDRAGYSYISSRFRMGIYTHLVYWNPHRPVDKCYKQLGRVLGFDADFAPMDLNISRQDKEEALRLLASLGMGPHTRILGINANAGELSTERRWPIENFAKIIGGLPADEGLGVLLFGSPAERTYVERLESMLAKAPVKIHNLCGKLSFPVFIEILKRLSLFITNDTGPLHLADLLRVSTVSVWGPTSPLIYGPRGKHHKAFYREIYCSPCVHITETPPCQGNNQCLKRLSWRPVLRYALSVLGYDRPESFCGSDGKEKSDFMAGYWPR